MRNQKGCIRNEKQHGLFRFAGKIKRKPLFFM